MYDSSAAAQAALEMGPATPNRRSDVLCHKDGRKNHRPAEGHNVCCVQNTVRYVQKCFSIGPSVSCLFLCTSLGEAGQIRPNGNKERKFGCEVYFLCGEEFSLNLHRPPSLLSMLTPSLPKFPHSLLLFLPDLFPPSCPWISPSLPLHDFPPLPLGSPHPPSPGPAPSLPPPGLAPSPPLDLPLLPSPRISPPSLPGSLLPLDHPPPLPPPPRGLIRILHSGVTAALPPNNPPIEGLITSAEHAQCAN